MHTLMLNRHLPLPPRHSDLVQALGRLLLCMHLRLPHLDSGPRPHLMRLVVCDKTTSGAEFDLL